MDGWKPSIPSGDAFDIGTPEYTKMEKKGLKELGKVGFVLVAGGLGERLGYTGAKVRMLVVLVEEGTLSFYLIGASSHRFSTFADWPAHGNNDQYIVHSVLLRVHQSCREQDDEERDLSASLYYGFW